MDSGISFVKFHISHGQTYINPYHGILGVEEAVDHFILDHFVRQT